MRPRRRLRFTSATSVALAAAISAVLASSATATADPGDVRPLDIGRIEVQGFANVAAAEAQLTLGSFKTWLLDRPEFSVAGYVESVNDAATLSTTILWHGTSPLQEDVQAEGRKRGISVSFQPWVANMGTLKAGAAAVEATLKKDPEYKNFQLAFITLVDPDVPGLSVVGSFKGAEPDEERAKAAMLDGLRNATSVPLTLVSNVLAVPTVTRSTDTRPVNAGGYMRSAATGATCSSGFALVSNGIAHTTTARHCRSNDYVARDGSTSYGTLVSQTTAGQARVLSAPGAALAFDGPWNAVNSRGAVGGRHDPSINDQVCTSGGNSGVHCNIVIESITIRNDGYGSETNFAARQFTGDIAAIQGDSGGPVLVPVAGKFFAVGMIQAGFSPFAANCGAVRDNGICSANLLFTTQRDILGNLGSAWTLKTQ